MENSINVNGGNRLGSSSFYWIFKDQGVLQIKLYVRKISATTTQRMHVKENTEVRKQSSIDAAVMKRGPGSSDGHSLVFIKSNMRVFPMSY